MNVLWRQGNAAHNTEGGGAKRRDDMTPRRCGFNIPTMLSTRKRVDVKYRFDCSSQKIEVHWEWPRSQPRWDMTVVTVDNAIAELPFEEKKKKRKEARRYAKPDIRHFSLQRYPIRPEETRDEEVPRGAYTATRLSEAERNKSEMHTVRVPVMPGRETSVCVELLEGGAQLAVISPCCLKHNAFSRSEMERLYDSALKFIDNHCGINRWSPFERLIRCKPSDYFDYVKSETGNYMIPYLKDRNGHAACAINGRRDGLFFSINTSPLTSSPFGEMKFEIDASKLLSRKEHRVYFADFYCNYTKRMEQSAFRPHYITLVVCKKGSDNDRFCQGEGLIEVDITKEGSIVRMHRVNAWQTTYSVIGKNPEVYVEVFYTEPVKMHMGSPLEKIPVRGDGQSTDEGRSCTRVYTHMVLGIKRIPECTQCDH